MEWIEPILTWAKENKTFFAWVASISAFAFLLSLLLVPFLVRKIPEDYFLEEDPKADAIRESHPVLRVVFLILKNLLGWIVLLSGILMLLTPGQGILTILIGIMMINFPGKRPARNQTREYKTAQSSYQLDAGKKAANLPSKSPRPLLPRHRNLHRRYENRFVISPSPALFEPNHERPHSTPHSRPGGNFLWHLRSD